MVLSMTGFGQANNTYKDKSITVEIKSLNGKLTDIRCKIPASYKEKELILRKVLLEKAFRGKFEFNVTVGSDKGDGEYGLNKALFTKYYKELSELHNELGIENGDITQAIMRIPNIVGAVNGDVEEGEWDVVYKTTIEAIRQLNDFRAEEGIPTCKDLEGASNMIMQMLEEIQPYEANRIELIKERFKKNLEEFITNEQVDRNRFEQELIYYIEKLDINEEKVRLSQHCKYFNEVLLSPEVEVGKKLGFIAQEMGREINTLGAKAQDKNIQQRVVIMKDALEKIKEQVANII